MGRVYYGSLSFYTTGGEEEIPTNPNPLGQFMAPPSDGDVKHGYR